jgi:hypothetical protein
MNLIDPKTPGLITWSKESKTFATEMSMLESYDIEPENHYDPVSGHIKVIWIKSHKFSCNVPYVLRNVVKSEGDVLYWEFRPMTCHEGVSLTGAWGTTLKIFND